MLIRGVAVGNYQKSGAVDDAQGYREWARLHQYCQACGIPGHRAARERWPGLSTHHVCKPGRSDEPCNLLRLCRRDHDLAELLTVRVGGETLPTLPLSVCLALKKTREPCEWDPSRLARLLGHPLPELGPIPEFLAREWRRWRGVV